MFNAALHNRVEILDLLLKRRAGINELSPSWWGSTPLHGAAFFGRPQAAAFLLARRADANLANDFGACPLHYCGFDGSAEIAESLLKYDADANLACAPVTLQARLFVRMAFIRTTLGSASPGMRFVSEAAGCNCIGFSAKTGQVEMCQVLVQAKADVNHRNDRGFSALDLAKQHALSEVLLAVLTERCRTERTTIRTPRPAPRGSRMMMTSTASRLLHAIVTTEEFQANEMLGQQSVPEAQDEAWSVEEGAGTERHHSLRQEDGTSLHQLQTTTRRQLRLVGQQEWDSRDIPM